MLRQTPLALVLLVAACLAEYAAAFAPVAPAASASLLRQAPAARMPLRAAKSVRAARGFGGARMALGGSEILSSVPGVLLAGEIFGQVAAGGILIIMSGVIGAFAVGAIANLDDLEDTYRAENPEAEMMRIMQFKQKMEREQGKVNLPKDVEQELQEGGKKE